MKNFKYIIYTALFALLVIGCEAESAKQDSTEIGNTNNYPTATFAVDTDETTFNEGDESVITITVTTDKAINRDLNFGFVAGGTAVLHEDYELVEATVKAYETTGTMSIEILSDSAKETAETLELEVISGPSLASKHLVHPNTTYPTMSLTINNYISEDLEMSFDWDKIITLGADYHTCDYLDLDIYVSDAAGFDIIDPGATFNSTNYAATGDCPEVLIWDMSAWGDGDYVIWHENWANGFEGSGVDELSPITATIVKAGEWSTTVIQDDSQAVHLNDGGEDDAVPNDTHGIIFFISVSGGEYTLYDYAGNEITID